MNVPQGTQRKKKTRIQPHACITLSNVSVGTVSVWSSSTQILHFSLKNFIPDLFICNLNIILEVILLEK